MSKSLATLLKSVPDHRRKQGLMYPMVPLLVMMILANMSGCYGYREMAKYMEYNLKYFSKIFELKHGVPKHVSLRTFVQKLNFKSLLLAFSQWSGAHVELEQGDIVNIDGKGMNSTVEHCHSAEQNYKSMVSLFCEKTGTVLDVVMIEMKKDHEIGAAQQLISQLDSKGLIITADALHCQKKHLAIS